jgi:hypothetical protein
VLGQKHGLSKRACCAKDIHDRLEPSLFLCQKTWHQARVSFLVALLTWLEVFFFLALTSLARYYHDLQVGCKLFLKIFKLIAYQSFCNLMLVSQIKLVSFWIHNYTE